jgi:hypothetical protein
MTDEPRASVEVAGALDGLEAYLVEDSDDVVSHRLWIGTSAVELAPLLGGPLALEFAGRISCRHCGASTARSYGEGHCYMCFKRLARCDLCVVSPDRCHYHLGTCREPDWGTRFCMTPHLVYLANSSGLKVGITRDGNLPGRWLEQGATQGLVVMNARTRHQAGCIEAALRRYVADRTDSRMLLRGDARELDLVAEWQWLSRAARLDLERAVAPFGSDVSVAATLRARLFRYPVTRYPEEQPRLRLDSDVPVAGRLLGAKGSYLLFDTGVFNVREHTSYHVELKIPDRTPEPVSSGQLRLF